MPGEVGQADCFLRQAFAGHEQLLGLRMMIWAKPSRETGGCLSRELPLAWLRGALPEHRVVESSRRTNQR